MNRLAVLLALALCLPLTAHADEASRRAKAEELVTLLHLDRTVTQLVDIILQQSTSIATKRFGGTLTPETQVAFAEFQKKLVAVLDPQIGWKVIEPEYTRLCASTFSEEELDGMITFYKSPAGKALLEKMPVVSKQANQLVQEKLTALQPQVNQMFNDFEKSQVPASAPALTTPPVATPATPPPAKSNPQ